jgi:hypothetical protein
MHTLVPMPSEPSTSASDRFEPEYHVAGTILARDKFVGRKFQWLLIVPTILFALMTIAGLVVELAGGAPAGALAATAVGGIVFTVAFALMWAVLPVLRTVVTDRELRVQCGLWGPRIPIDRITRCEVASQHTRLRIGKRYEIPIGKGNEKGMWTTSYLLRTGDHVRLTFTDDNGKSRRLLFTPDDPAAIAAAIMRARAGAVAGGRIAAYDIDAITAAPEAAQEQAAAEDARALSALRDRRGR